MKAKLSYLRVSPRKTRLVADLVRGKDVEEAINILTFTRRAASEPLRKLIESAPSGNTTASTFRTRIEPRRTSRNVTRAPFTVPLAVLSVIL